MTVHVGIVGTGVGIRTHLASMRQIARVQVDGVVGSSIERAELHLREAGEDTSLACGWDELLSRSPDLLCITTPLPNRDDYMRQLADYPGLLLVEKPVCATQHGCRTLRQVLGGAVQRAYTDFQLRGAQVFRFVRGHVAAGGLGTPTSLSLFERNSSFRTGALPEWAQSRSSGGGQMFSMGSHLLDLAVFLGGLEYEHITNAGITGRIGSPRREWSSGQVGREVSDEHFECFFTQMDCSFTLSTTAISPGARSLEARIEGTEGCVEFRFRDGQGRLDVWASSGPKASYAVGAGGVLVEEGGRVPLLNPSFFRVVHPAYIEMIVDKIELEEDRGLASLADGIANSSALLASIGGGNANLVGCEKISAQHGHVFEDKDEHES